MPIVKPGELDMYGQPHKAPTPPPEGPSPEQKLGQYYRDIESERAGKAAAQAELDAIGRSGLVQVSARVGNNSEETVCYLNPDTIASIAPMAGKELEACIVTTADGATYKVHESTEAFSRRLAPPDLQPSGPTARLTEYHRSKAAAR